MRLAILLALLALPATAEEFGIPAADIQSGTAFLTPETQALQADAFANPGLLWVDRGQKLFTQGQPACVACHEEGLSGAATRYPAIDAPSGALVNLEGRINLCRTQHQNLPALEYESDDLLALTALVTAQSNGQTPQVSIDGAAAADFTAGETYFFTRRGQMNLSCAQCHDENWGRKLRGDTISQGHLNGFPAYRLEWQSVGSAHRRLRDCDVGVRAKPLPYGDPTYVALQLYLAARSQGLALESPAIRR